MNYLNYLFRVIGKKIVFRGLLMSLLTISFSVSGQYTLPQLFQNTNFIGSSNANNQNVNHPDGADYQDLKRAAGIMVISSAGADGFCSCTIMNNAQQDGKILLVTAAHCIPGLNIGVEVGITLSFNYEHPDALARGSQSVDIVITRVFIVGGTLRLLDLTTDIALVELRKEGSEEWYEHVYASGWNASLSADPTGNISHPSRDQKKIFLHPEKSNLTDRQFLSTSNQLRKGYFYETVGAWNGRRTYPQTGASGSGLFDTNGDLLAVLTAGSNEDQLYSAIANNWYDDNGHTLRSYLDPSGHWLSAIPGGYLNELISVNMNFDLTINPGQIFQTPGANPDEPSLLMGKVINLRPLLVLDGIETNNGSYLEDIFGIKINNANASKIELTVHALLQNEGSGEYYEKFIYGSYADQNAVDVLEGFKESSWECGSDLGEFAPCERENDESWWPVQNTLGSSIIYLSAIVRSFVAEAGQNETIQSIKDTKIPVVLRLKNLGTEPVQFQAVSYSGDVPRNALQLFKPEEVADQFRFRSYRQNRGENSANLHIKSITLTQGDYIRTIQTGDNGGYVNLVNPNFKLGPFYTMEYGNPLTVTAVIHNDTGAPFSYKVWIDYFNTEALGGIETDHTYNFVLDPRLHPEERLKAENNVNGDQISFTLDMPSLNTIQLPPGSKRKTRLRIEISDKNNEPPYLIDIQNVPGQSHTGETEDYLIEIVAPTKEEIVAATEANPNKKVHLTGKSSTDPTCDSGQHAPAEDTNGGTHSFGSTASCPEGNCYNTSNFVTYGSAIDFSGNNILEIDQCDAFIHEGFSERTVAMWIYPTSGIGHEVLYDEGGVDDGVAIRLNSGIVEVEVSSSASQSELKISSTTSLALNQWHHIMAVFDDGKLSLHQNDDPAVEVDGASQFTSIPYHPDQAALGGTLGTDAFGEPNNSFSGFINNVIIWSFAVQATYASSKFRLGTANSGNRMASEEHSGDTTEVTAGPTFNLFPNPAKDHLNVLVEVRKPGPLKLEIVDLKGRQVYEMVRDHISVGHQLITLRNLNLPAGQYVLVVQAGDVVRREKILIE